MYMRTYMAHSFVCQHVLALVVVVVVCHASSFDMCKNACLYLLLSTGNYCHLVVNWTFVSTSCFFFAHVLSSRFFLVMGTVCGASYRTYRFDY